MYKTASIPEQKNPPPLRDEGLLRGTTLHCSKYFKPLRIALSGETRHRLLIFTGETCLQRQQASSVLVI